jgi:prepilin-type N-terminal cleavage/methylation domain-containing protein
MGRALARSGKPGFSLAEMMVSLAIGAIIMTGAFQVIQEGMQLYRTNQAAADAQSNVTRVLGVLSLDIANAAAGVCQDYPSGGAGRPGIVFATPLAEGGGVRYDAGNGTIYWQRYICYYFEPDPNAASGGHDGKIWRAYTPVAPEDGLGGNRDLGGVVQPWVADPSHGPDYFAANANERRVLSNNISGFDISVYTGAEFGTAAARRAYDVVVEAGDKGQKHRNDYYIKVTTRVVPRG